MLLFFLYCLILIHITSVLRPKRCVFTSLPNMSSLCILSNSVVRVLFLLISVFPGSVPTSWSERSILGVSGPLFPPGALLSPPRVSSRHVLPLPARQPRRPLSLRPGKKTPPGTRRGASGERLFHILWSSLRALKGRIFLLYRACSGIVFPAEGTKASPGTSLSRPCPRTGPGGIRP